MTTDIQYDAATTASPTPASGPAAQAHCRNCNAPLLGPHCYVCGQPVNGLMRPLGSLFGDFMDSVFDLDLRFVRSVGPLFRKPGFLTREYFAGRQIRYVTPVRLFFFLCILAFFVARFAVDGDSGISVNANNSPDGDISAAMSEPDVIARRDAALKRLADRRTKLPAGPPRAGAESRIDMSADKLRSDADARLKALRAAAAKGEPPPAPETDDFSFNGTPWDAKTNPLHVSGAPGFVDTWLNEKVRRAKQNIARIKADPAQYVDAFVGAIPTALFVLVPLFALLLKLAYLFKRRLYMEHLIVALHSHAFLSLDLLLVFACQLLQRLVPEGGALFNVLAVAIGLLIAWIPIYLLLMQKRVYAQGWPMTLIKYFVLGTVYMGLLGFAISGAAIASLVWL